MAGAPNKAGETKPNTTDFFDHLSIGEKSKLKWKGNRQELKSFVETTLSLTGEWSSNDSMLKFKSNGITITFYDSTQKTLLIQGKISDELIQHLLNIASKTGDTRLSAIEVLRDFLRKNLDGDENKCKGECSEIYPIQNEHIKRVGILGSKSQFCAAFYHVHEWNNKKHFCLDEDSCIIAKRTKKDVMEFAQEAEKFAEKVKNLDEELANEFHEEAKQFAAKKLNISAREGKEFVEKTNKFAMKAQKSFDKRKKAVEKQNKAKKSTNQQKKAKQFPEEAQQLIEEAEQLVEKAKKAVSAWCFQAKTVVAVVKFEKDRDILYEARYTNCSEEKKHAEDFFKDDIEKGELGEKVKANPNGTITLYLTLQPCNKSTGKTANTNSNQSCCTILKTIYENILQKRTISLCVKAANTCRLTVKREDAKDDKENEDEEIDKDEDNKVKDEKYRKNAVRGIKRLMRIGVNVGGMTKKDWRDYLFAMTNPDVPREYDARRKDLDESVQETFTKIQTQVNRHQLKKS